jgi:3-phenylpropionate/trans-cinnamate dioxygenase ferredoxin reductase subunit
MDAKRIVIVGAGPAGTATARAYREHGGQASVLLLSQESHIPYRRPPLSKEFLRGELTTGELAIESEQWFRENDVQLQLETPVSAIDPIRGAVMVRGSVMEAEAIVLATGSEPVRSGIAGLEHPAVMTLRTLADSTRLSKQARRDSEMLVLGTGFIGCEVAASLSMHGANVTLLGEEPLPLIQRLGQDAAQRIAGWLMERGVKLQLEVEVKAVHDGHVIELKDGSRLVGDCVILGLGARPRAELAETAGLKLDDGAVYVDTQMRVPDTDGRVLVVGDLAAAKNRSAGRHLRVEHWGDALEHGEIAGRTLAGEDVAWDSVPGFWSSVGAHTVKYSAWGDGYNQARFVEHPHGAFTVWYTNEAGVLVGVLTYECDEDYERGQELIKAGKTFA